MDEHTKELLSVFAEKANGATMCGYPIAEFSRDELMGVVGQLIGEKEHWEGRAAEYLDLFSPRQIKESYVNYVSFSGGADSTAVAILLHEQGADFELLFADTGAELPETYWTITRVSQMLGKKLTVVSNGGFYMWLVQYGYLLPSAVQRWCTRALKRACLNKFTGDDDIQYIGIRADEQHRAKIRAKYKIEYPIINAGLDKKGVIALCKKHDLLNPIYEWRSSCSCFCCPFQRKQDWRNMWQRHPDIYKLAEQWEETSVERAAENGHKAYRWNERYSLKELRDADDAQFNMFPECEAEACLICKYS